MKIGPYQFDNPLALAPMAGVTDEPFRQVCKRAGAGMTWSEMVSSDHRLWNTSKSLDRLRVTNSPAEISIAQLVGSDPVQLSEAARMLVDRGFQVIDINMGCPAKKVCKKAAGSALMAEPELVRSILRSVINAVDTPVTLKMRTGISPEKRNAPELAMMAEQEGIAAITVHGRTRACKFEGDAEFKTIAKIKHAISIPVIANGDIDSAKKAKLVLDQTNADGIMVGRAALGNPWIFREIAHYLDSGKMPTPPTQEEVGVLVSQHLQAIHSFYDDAKGVKFARKHMSWYLHQFCKTNTISKVFNGLTFKNEQTNFIESLFRQDLQKHFAFNV